MPKVIAVDQLTDGMILAEPLMNNFGQTLIPAGTKLFQRHSRILRTWNIRTIAIKSDESEEEREISVELMEISRDKLQKKMKWEPRNKIETDLFNMGLLHLARKLSTKKEEIDG